jgi:hypothetical protein
MTCPKCNSSYIIGPTGVCLYGFALSMLGALVFLIIFFPLSILFFMTGMVSAMGVVFSFFPPLRQKMRRVCGECRYRWKPV